MTPMTSVPLIDPAIAARRDHWRERFAGAQPFRHVVIDDFLALDLAQRLLQSFPAFEQGNAIGDDGRPGNKSTLARIRRLGGAWEELDEAISSRPFLDWVGAVTFLAEHDTVSGPVNLCCPQTPTNAEFTRELARLVHRPAFFTVPAAVLRPAAGRMAPELLGSVRAVPQALEDAGFEFADRTVAEVLASATAR